MPGGPCYSHCTHASKPRPEPSAASPLDILAAAVTAVEGHDVADHPTHESSAAPYLQAAPPVDCLAYFGPPDATTQTDWQVLAEQSVENTFKLESTACDPVAARLIDEADAHYLFNQYA